MTHPALRLDGLIFDVDGTLADNLPAIFDAFRVALASIGGRYYGDDEIYGMFGPIAEEIFQRVARDRWQAAFDTYLAHYRRLAQPQAIEMPGIQELLVWVQVAGLPLGVVSGAGRSTVDVTLAALGLHPHFGHILTNDIPARPKRHNLEAMTQRWGIPAQRLGYIGDSPTDIENALMAGLAPLGAAWGRASRYRALRAAGAVAIFTHPDELRAWLLTPAGPQA